MPRKKKKELSMRKVREILRLITAHNVSNREVSRSCSVSPATVGNYLKRIKESELPYSQIEEMDDEQLKKLLKTGSAERKGKFRPQPDWKQVHKELKRKGVTLQLLWEEYKQVHLDGYQKTQFCDRYRIWRNKLNVSLRQTHKAGEKVFVDYAGQTVPVVDRLSGEVRKAEIFVAALGASNYTYAEATWSQSLENWIGSHVRTFEFYKGVPLIVVPDNLKSGVSRACRYEPDINPSYHDMAVHYGTAIIPARVRKPKDKAKAENAVLLVERWILAVLRNRTFFSLDELNQAIAELLERLNNRLFKKLPGSRLSWFEEIDQPALLPLPQSRYVLAEWKKARVNIDYHIELNRHYYSVPYKLIHEEVNIRYTVTTVEIFHRGNRVASHLRNDSPGKHTTVKEHMPTSHQKYLEWTPTRIINWADTIGKSTARVVETIMSSREHPEQGYRSCMGILRLGKQYSSERLEAACCRAIAIRGYSYKSVRSILDKKLDQLPLSDLEPPHTTVTKHRNIRGVKYYH
jgi:transposase